MEMVSFTTDLGRLDGHASNAGETAMSASLRQSHSDDLRFFCAMPSDVILGNHAVLTPVCNKGVWSAKIASTSLLCRSPTWDSFDMEYELGE